MDGFLLSASCMSQRSILAVLGSVIGSQRRLNGKEITLLRKVSKIHMLRVLEARVTQPIGL